MMSAEYIRFAALGDSASCGVGDPTPQGWRGWAQLLAEAMATSHHVSFCKLAVSGACVSDVVDEQLDPGVEHQAVITSLVVGLNDVMRSRWDPEALREDLLHCADRLTRQGSLLITVRFHDHTRVLGLPELLARPMRRRIEVLNGIYDEVHDRYGVLQLDLAADPAIYDRELWALDRLHPSELGHRRLARKVGALLQAEGLAFELPSLECSSPPMSMGAVARMLVTDVAPWVGRRVRDLGPWAAREAVRRGRDRLHVA